MTSSNPQQTTRGTSQLGRAEALPKGALRPAAQPIGAFFAPGRVELQGPAKPAMVPTTPRFNIQQQGSGGNVAGANRGAQWAQALGRFNQALLEAAGLGLEIYATGEYTKGQNEIWKAYTLSTEDMLAEGDAYAASTRTVYRQDPIAGLMMDQVNPFRFAGRQDAVSQVAAAEIGSVMRQDYRDNAMDLAPLDPGAPELNQVRARSVAQVMTKYGITEWTPGFAKHVLPNLNRAWEQVQAQHQEDRSTFLKSTIGPVLSTNIGMKLVQWRNEGIPIEEQARVVGQMIDEQARKLGIPGEAMNLARDAIITTQQKLIQEGEPELAQILSLVPVGPPREDGIRTRAAQAFGLEMIEANEKYESIREQGEARNRKQQMRAASSVLAETALQAQAANPDDPTAGPRVAAALLNDPAFDEQFPGLTTLERLQLANEVNSTVEGFQASQFTTVEMDQWLGTLEGGSLGFGSQVTPDELRTADQEFREKLQRVPPESRGDAIRRYNAWRQQEQNQPNWLINPAIAGATKGLLAELFPDDVGIAALRGLTDLGQVMAWGDSRQQAAAANIESRMRLEILKALDVARTNKGGELSDVEAQTVITDAVRRTASTVREKPEQYAGTPSERAAAQSPQGQQGQQGQQQEQERTFTPGQLGNIPNRPQRLANWRNVPVLNPQSIEAMIGPALQGDYPREFRRFAADAGTTPAALLLRQVDLYPDDITLTQAVRKRLQSQGARAQGVSNYNEGQNPVMTALGRAGGFIANILTGASPVMAAAADSPGPVALPVVPTSRPAGGTPPPAPVLPPPVTARAGGTPPPAPALPVQPALVTHPDIGKGYALPGLNDYRGRPVVLSAPALQTLPAMIRDSGGQFKSSDINSSQRSPAKNASLGAAAHPNSGHLYGEKLDIQGASYQWLRQNGARYGWRWVYDMAQGVGDFEYVGPGARSDLAAPGDTSRTLALMGGEFDSVGTPQFGVGTPRFSVAIGGGGRGVSHKERLGIQFFPNLPPKPSLQASAMSIALAPGSAGGSTTQAAPAGGGDFKGRYFTRMAFLESNIDPSAFNREGSTASGYFQLTGDTRRDLIRRGHQSIVTKMLSSNLATAIQGAYEYARLQKGPIVDQLLAAGDVAGLDRLLNGLWVSLPGGSQPQAPIRYQQANTYLNP